MGIETSEYAESLWGPAGEEAPARPSRGEVRAERRARREEQREQRESAAVDDILRKINEHGIESLTGAERRRLREATKKRQAES